MNRPKLSQPAPAGTVEQLPMGPSVRAGHLVDVSSGMRTFRPIIDAEKCVGCLKCFLLCPDGTIDKSGEVLEIDYDYCKGCGVCARACKFGAITMVKEADA